MRVAGALADKPSRRVDAATPIDVVGAGPRFVGRGGEKLDAALDRFAVAVEGRRCLDAGASTGGFTDCLLQRGAAHVVAVDVGHGQLAASLRDDVRVTSLERTNVRHLTPMDVGGAVDVTVADLSFISLTTVAPALVSVTRPGGDLVVLVKPQFEAGRAAVARGRGVVRDDDERRRAIDRVQAAFVDQDARVIGVMVSPLTGSSGNVEYLVHLRTGAGD